MKLKRIIDQEVRNYMYMKKNKIVNMKKSKLSFKHLWFVNLVMFAFIVFLGIEQAGRGAEISSLEDRIEEKIVYKRDLSEEIFKVDSDEKISLNATELGFIKPTKVHYFKTDEIYASLLK